MKQWYALYVFLYSYSLVGELGLNSRPGGRKPRLYKFNTFVNRTRIQIARGIQYTSFFQVTRFRPQPLFSSTPIGGRILGKTVHSLWNQHGILYRFKYINGLSPEQKHSHNLMAVTHIQVYIYSNMKSLRSANHLPWGIIFRAHQWT